MKFKSRPRRLTVLEKDLNGARPGNYNQCVVAKAARRQWRKRVGVAGFNQAYITVWPKDPRAKRIHYVCTDPLFTQLVQDFDGGRPLMRC